MARKLRITLALASLNFSISQYSGLARRALLGMGPVDLVFIEGSFRARETFFALVRALCPRARILVWALTPDAPFEGFLAAADAVITNSERAQAHFEARVADRARGGPSPHIAPPVRVLRLAADPGRMRPEAARPGHERPRASGPRRGRRRKVVYVGLFRPQNRPAFFRALEALALAAVTRSGAGAFTLEVHGTGWEAASEPLRGAWRGPLQRNGLAETYAEADVVIASTADAQRDADSARRVRFSALWPGLCQRVFAQPRFSPRASRHPPSCAPIKGATSRNLSDRLTSSARLQLSRATQLPP